MNDCVKTLYENLKCEKPELTPPEPQSQWSWKYADWLVEQMEGMTPEEGREYLLYVWENIVTSFPDKSKCDQLTDIFHRRDFSEWIDDGFIQSLHCWSRQLAYPERNGFCVFVDGEEGRQKFRAEYLAKHGGAK